MLSLGNVELVAAGNNKPCMPKDASLLTRVAGMLGVEGETLLTKLTSRRMIVSGETVDVVYSAAQAADARDALAKAIYVNLFSLVISEINLKLRASSCDQDDRFIGLLDI